jgi:hypothetical protein
MLRAEPSRIRPLTPHAPSPYRRHQRERHKLSRERSHLGFGWALMCRTRAPWVATVREGTARRGLVRQRSLRIWARDASRATMLPAGSTVPITVDIPFRLTDVFGGSFGGQSPGVSLPGDGDLRACPNRSFSIRLRRGASFLFKASRPRRVAPLTADRCGAKPSRRGWGARAVTTTS